MADDSRVQQLLDEIFESGRTPEEVSGACPELLPELRKRWQQICLVDAELDAMFPTQVLDQDSAPSWHPDAGLPRIPGYEVVAVLGRGGMGVVYKARHLRLNRLVALKMLLAGVYASPEERERFMREAEAVAGLQHVNIVQVHDVGDHEGRPFFTMEFVEGGSLARRSAGKPLPAREAAALVATLAEAVQVAHQGGIVHRDLKPANILLTADGTPKIADFGLARRFENGPALTLSGARVGTPSYMAPEQALGKVRALGPSADIYALGALLYEMLTGRPPFQAETAAETERQVIVEEPVSPTRLNANVPRDLETICLKCLNKDPERRYPTAAALAEDLHRFQRGEPIVGRPTSFPERLTKWVRRHPTQVVVLLTSMLLAATLVVGSVWFVVQQAQRRNAFEADLSDVTRLQESARWAEARAALDRAELRLGETGPNDLHQRLEQARRDYKLVTQMDSIRLRRVTRGELVFYKDQADREYEKAFQNAGLGKILEQPQDVAAKINASAVRPALVSALEDWAICAADKERRRWLLDVARGVSPDQDGWRERVYSPVAWDDAVALADLAKSAPVTGQSLSLLLALGERLRDAGGDAVPFLKRVQKEHPADFWANLILGNTILQLAPQEAGGYYRAALASRPAAAVGYCAVGDALRLQKGVDEAIDYYQKALQFDANYARAYSNLGHALENKEQLDEAIHYYQKALQIDPDYAWAHHNLGNALRIKGQFDEAYEQYRQVIRLDPKNSEARNGLTSVLLRLGRGAEAQISWRGALAANPPKHDAWFGYAELCLFLGQQEEYNAARHVLLERFGTTTDPFIAERVSRACLLLPDSEEALHRAVALADRAAVARGSVAEWIYPFFLFAKGLAEFRQGRLESTLAIMNGEASHVMGPAPRLIIAMAQHRLGQKLEARKSLAMAVLAFDWRAAEADSRDLLICHIFRREAEGLILPNISEFLEGKVWPQDTDEQLGLLGICQYQGLNFAAARLYAEAFAADPILAEDLNTKCRYSAARCAALAGGGLGKDGAKVSQQERTRWRKQARAWLQADLAAWAKKLESNFEANHVLVQKTLTLWRADADLAGLREQQAIVKLPADEQKECLALWNEVGAVLERAQRTR